MFCDLYDEQLNCAILTKHFRDFGETIAAMHHSCVSACGNKQYKTILHTQNIIITGTERTFLCNLIVV